MIGIMLRNIDDDAVKWAAKTLSGSMSSEEQAACEAWLSSDRRRRRAYDKYMEIADLAAEIDDSSAAATLERDLERFARRRSSQRAWIVAAPAMAASIAAAILFSIVMNSRIEPEHFATARGESAEVLLADGSTVSLNTDSKMEVRISDAQRRVTLEDGEAFFIVSRDSARPFVVSAKHVEVTVVGTKFNIGAISGTETVSVISGIVRVNTFGEGSGGTSSPEDGVVTLVSGQQLIYDSKSGTVDVQSFNPEQVSAWLSGEAIYDGQRLEDVVNDLNRYFPNRLELGDPSLNDMPVSGVFDVTDPAATIDGLTLAFSLRQVRTTNGDIRLVPNNQ